MDNSDVFPLRIAKYLGIAGALALAWVAGPLTWLASGWSAPLADPVLAGRAASSAAVKTSVAAYTEWNLFGQAPKLEQDVRQVAERAPETRLGLDLYGVVVGDTPADSGAIIAPRGGEANYFQVDAILPGNARLAAVYDDRVLLERQGSMEVLSFEGANAASTSGIRSAAFGSGINHAASGDAATAAPSEQVETAGEFVEVAERRLREDPVSALSSVGLEAAGDGASEGGYRFNGQNPILTNVGLQKGDVIRSVNGHPLGDVQRDRGMLQQFYQSGTVEVEIERDGAVFTVSYPVR